jgi:hypothetical protein
MALPTLDSVFASAADLPRRQMLAKWLVEELDSGSIADYWTLPERYLWAKIAVAAGAPRSEADYISLPKQYAWSDIYNAVSGNITQSTVVVSGLSDTQYNGRYIYNENVNGRPSYKLTEFITLSWNGSESWILEDGASGDYTSSGSDVAYPWLATGWFNDGLDPTDLVLTPETPNHTDWSEKQALGHIAAAYRGDTGNPANLATYIDWPWRYQMASIITKLVEEEPEPEPETYNAVIVSGAGSTEVNGTYTERGLDPFYNNVYYNLIGQPDNSETFAISYDGADWVLFGASDPMYNAAEALNFPWQNENWLPYIVGIAPPPTLTPTNV